MCVQGNGKADVNNCIIQVLVFRAHIKHRPTPNIKYAPPIYEALMVKSPYEGWCLILVEGIV